MPSTTDPSRINLYINEVVPRDGFQNEAKFIDTDDKIALIDRLSNCGFAKIEVTSFTSPRAIPALRDAEAVMHRIRRHPDVLYTVLVPNARGAERALACQIDEANLVMSLSKSHNRANLRMGREQSFQQLQEVVAVLKRTPVLINVSLSTTFGCPMLGDIADDEIWRWMDRFAAIGVHGFTLCDTTGMAFPSQVQRICEGARTRFGEQQLTLHFHNTRGMALANTLAAINAGVVRFDAALGGLGGCPYAPGASGNVCTEDMIHMLDLMGYRTGIDLTAVLQAACLLPAMIGHEVPGQVLKAGRRLDLHPQPEQLQSA